MLLRTFSLSILLGILLTTIVGCRAVPLTGREQLMLTSESYENDLGREAFKEYLQKLPVSKNTRYNTCTKRAGEALKNAAPPQNYQWEFVVFDSKTQNAFCLPGGKVAVYSGLIDVMDNEAELACVIAHEISHALARHGGERMSWSMLQTLGALGIALGWNNQTLNDIYGTGSQLGIMLPFSRNNEYEADRMGLILMAKAGYDPNAAIQFWTRFSQGKRVSYVEKITSTHPCDAERIRNFQNYMPEAEIEYQNALQKRGLGDKFSH